MRRLAVSLACALASHLAFAVLPQTVQLSAGAFRDSTTSLPTVQTNIAYTIPSTASSSYRLGTFTLYPPVGSIYESTYPNGLQVTLTEQMSHISVNLSDGGSRSGTAQMSYWNDASPFQYECDTYWSGWPLEMSATLTYKSGVKLVYFKSASNYTCDIKTTDSSENIIPQNNMFVTAFSSEFMISTREKYRGVFYHDTNGIRRNLSTTPAQAVVSNGDYIVISNDVGRALFLNDTDFGVSVNSTIIRSGECAQIETSYLYSCAATGQVTGIYCLTTNSCTSITSSTWANLGSMYDDTIVVFSSSTNYNVNFRTFQNRAQYPVVVHGNYGFTMSIPANSGVVSCPKAGTLTISTSAPSSNRIEYIGYDDAAHRVTSTPSEIHTSEADDPVVFFQDEYQTITFTNPTAYSIDIWTTYGVFTIPPHSSRTLQSLFTWKIRRTPTTPSLRGGARLLKSSTPTPPAGGTGSIVIFDEHGMPIVVGDDWTPFYPNDGDNVSVVEGYSTLLFGSDDVPIYGKNGTLLFAYPPYFEDVLIQTYWAFDQDAVGSPDAYINGNMVCNGHATGHIIAHSIVEQGSEWGKWDDKENGYVIRFSMSLDNSESSSASCNYVCWLDEDNTVTASSPGTANGVEHYFKLICNPFASSNRYRLEAE